MIILAVFFIGAVVAEFCPDSWKKFVPTDHVNTNNTYTYIEIKEYSTDQVTARVDVTGKTERQIDKTERGMNINLNHDKFYTAEAEYKTQQRTGLDLS